LNKVEKSMESLLVVAVDVSSDDANADFGVPYDDCGLVGLLLLLLS
jgi:hypothetical protein